MKFKSCSMYCSSSTVLFGRHTEKHVKMQFASVAMDTSNLNEHLICDVVEVSEWHSVLANFSIR